MTREELKEHCEKQIRACEMWAKCKGESPQGKVYEEHKLILELLEQDSILDKIRAEIEQEYKVESEHHYGQGLKRAIEILDKYKAESQGDK